MGFYGENMINQITSQSPNQFYSKNLHKKYYSSYNLHISAYYGDIIFFQWYWNKGFAKLLNQIDLSCKSKEKKFLHLTVKPKMLAHSQQSDKYFCSRKLILFHAFVWKILALDWIEFSMTRNLFY